jgi:hypothetical protein
LDTQLSRGYVFGCPVYVLDAALQDGKKIPKWNPHACLGLFLGFLDVHSSQVLLVLNVEMGKISPQFHVIFDNKFATVHSLPRDQPLAAQWENIFCLGRKCFLEVDYDDDNNPILPPPTDIIKLYAHARTNQQASQTTTPFLPINHEVGSPIGDSEGDLANNSLNQEVVFPIGDSAGELVNIIPQNNSQLLVDGPEGVPEGVVESTNSIPATCPRQNVGTYKEGPANICKFPIDGESHDFAFDVEIINEWEHPISSVKNKGCVTTEYHPQQKISKASIAECYLLQDTWFDDPTCVSAINNNFVLDSWDAGGYYFNEISNPRLLAAHTKSSKYNKDNPSFDTATRGPFQEEFWQAMRVKLNTLIYEFDCWEYVQAHGLSKSNAILMDG